jgi:hypothetical protein
MMYRVLSRRMAFEQGSVVDASDLSGNIEALVEAGHLEPVADKPNKKNKLQEPEAVPALEDDSAEEPEEHE